jgi:hypothetical protein
MVSNISQIVRHLFDKDTLEEVPESELRYFVTQYPYSGTGHLLLAKKLQLSGEKRAFDREVAVTSVYFANPAWLQYLFYAPGDAGVEPAPPHPADIEKEIEGHDELDVEQTEVEDQDVQPADEPIIIPPEEIQADDSTPEDQAPGSQETSQATAEIPAAFESILPARNFDTPESSPESSPFLSPAADTAAAESTEPQAAKALDPIPEAEITDRGSLEPSGIADEADSTHEAQITADESMDPSWIADEADSMSAAQIGVPESTDSSGIPEVPEVTTPAVNIPAEPVNRSFFISNISDTAPTVAAGASVGDESASAGVGTISAAASLSATRPDTGATESLGTKVTQAGTNAANEAAVAVDESKLDFDPYHTIDYFASQGIKLRVEDFSKDKLGQQLKSFTEWIRSMKRLPQQDVEGSGDETDQHAVRRIAEHSVEEKEVLTEAMAEVWAKQGNREKARQIYIKLSLQNPSKSSYFAAKIDQLTIS